MNIGPIDTDNAPPAPPFPPILTKSIEEGEEPRMCRSARILYLSWFIHRLFLYSLVVLFLASLILTGTLYGWDGTNYDDGGELLLFNIRTVLGAALLSVWALKLITQSGAQYRLLRLAYQQVREWELTHESSTGHGGEG